MKEIFTVILSIDLVTWCIWFGYYWGIGINQDKLLRDYHFDLVAHLLATLRMINITEQEWNGTFHLENIWWSIATFVFASVFDITTLVHIYKFLGNTSIYQWEQGIGWVFVITSCSYLLLMIIKKLSSKEKKNKCGHGYSEVEQEDPQKKNHRALWKPSIRLLNP